MIRRKIKLRIEPENMVFQSETPEGTKDNRRGRPPIWEAVAEMLKQAPEEWSLIGKDIHQPHVSRWRTGRFSFFPKGEFEFRTKGYNRDSQRVDEVWARYVGKGGI